MPFEAGLATALWLLGEKQVLPPDYPPQRRAWLEISGAYRLEDGKPVGRVNVKVKEPK